MAKTAFLPVRAYTSFDPQGQVGQRNGWEFEAMSQNGLQMLYLSPAEWPKNPLPRG
jgi:hypothetical protein